MISVSSTSNDRTYESHSDEAPQRKNPLKRQAAHFDFIAARQLFGRLRPAEVEIGVAYNAIIDEENLNSGPRHIREGKLTAPIDLVFSICLTAIEEGFHELSPEQFDRVLKLLGNRFGQFEIGKK